MVDIPQISGWPADYPNLDPKEQILIIHEDLEELKGNPKLANSKSWLTLFAANLYELDRTLEKLHGSSHFPRKLQEIRNWLRNCRINGQSLSEIARKMQKDHYKNTAELEQFLTEWITNDQVGFWGMFTVLSEYLRKKAM